MEEKFTRRKRIIWWRNVRVEWRQYGGDMYKKMRR
jgi:hypothetical protein